MIGISLKKKMRKTVGIYCIPLNEIINFQLFNNSYKL